MGTRLDQIETETEKLKSENRKLKARVCALESFARYTDAEVIGFLFLTIYFEHNRCRAAQFGRVPSVNDNFGGAFEV